MNNGEKWCYKCKSWKTKKAFGESQNRWDGLNSMCKECLSEDWHKRYTPHPKYVMTHEERVLADKEKRARYHRKKKIEKFGEEFVDVDMRGRHGNNLKGSDNPRWNHGQLISSQEYVLVRVSKDHPMAFGPPGSSHLYAYEHDLVVFEATGIRPSIDGLVVHHKDGNRQNNRIENLELKPNGKHISDHQRGRQLTEKHKHNISKGIKNYHNKVCHRHNQIS
uniref:Putative homing endonuclease n=1 Tax=viral metagenome TaxID=1070528 RepID=A0A6M3LFW1_9ZZZZ